MDWARGWLSDPHATWSIEHRLASITCPVFVVQGDADQFGTAAQVSAITKHVRTATTWMVPGAGHAPHIERRGAFVSRASSFIGKQP